MSKLVMLLVCGVVSFIMFMACLINGVRWAMNITLRQGRLSGVARATLPDKQSHLVINYCIMF